MKHYDNMGKHCRFIVKKKHFYFTRALSRDPQQQVDVPAIIRKSSPATNRRPQPLREPQLVLPRPPPATHVRRACEIYL